MSKVTVEISQQDAFEAGHSRYGAQPIDLDALLVDLDSACRRLLHVDSKGMLFFADMRVRARSPDQVDVLASIVRLREERAKRNYRQFDSFVGQIERWEADITYESSAGLSMAGDRVGDFSSTVVKRICGGVDADPEPYERRIADIVARRRVAHNDDWKRALGSWDPAGVEPTWPGYWQGSIVPQKDLLAKAEKLGLEQVVERVQAYEAKIKADKLARVEARLKSEAVWKAWAAEHGSGDLQYAIKHDYPTGKAIEREVLAVLLPAAEVVGAAETLDRNIAPPEDRRVPNQVARDLQQRLQTAVAANPLRLEGTEVSVGRIQAIEYWVSCACQDDPYEDYCDRGCDDDHEIKIKQTAVPVDVKSAYVAEVLWYVVPEDSADDK